MRIRILKHSLDIPVPEQNQMKYRSQLKAHQIYSWQDAFDRLTTKGANDQKLGEIGGYAFKDKNLAFK
jgi:hypothetical protein